MLSLSLLVGLLLVPAPAQAEQSAQALYLRGATWQAFYDAADVRRELWQTNTRRARNVGPELVERLKAAGSGLTLLAIAEAACSDSVNTVPFIAELAARAGVELRIVSRAVGEAVLARYPTPDGRSATPTIVLLRGGREVGAWVERPAALQIWFTSAEDVPLRERVDRKMAWYEWDRGDSTLSDFLALVERTAAGRF